MNQHKFAVTLDTETYPNCFVLVARICDTEIDLTFEISDYRNDCAEMHSFLCWLRDNAGRAYGFNIVGFDGPVIHTFMRMGGKATAGVLYEKAMVIIQSGDDEGEKFNHLVKPGDRDFEWVDLYRINHFHNRARATSLKVLEFTMRMDYISDLPFPVGQKLTQEQVRVLRDYCRHDVKATELFRTKNLEAVAFREHLSASYNRDMMNHDDVKIGSTVFEIMLENEGVSLYDYGPSGRTPRQTYRSVIALQDAILPWISFEQPEFQRVLEWLKGQIITETKGVFSDVVAQVNNFEYVFGLGGIHGSVENKVIVSDEQTVIESVDVSSYYPNLSISNRFYPEHIGEQFCDVYKTIYDLRKKFPKGTPENAAYKLAANGTYGKTNDRFSPFYDPLLTMKITLNGQLLLCVLAENLIKVPTVQIVMCNTDGLEYTVRRQYIDAAKSVCEWWQSLTKLTLEFARYDKLFVRDCNNYIGVYTDGRVKRKGAYEYDLEWHQNHSALVIPKVAEKVLLEGAPIRQTVERWPDLMDFMLRVKLPRAYYLQWGEERVPNISRYYVAKGGKPLYKWMPPLKGKSEWRKNAIEAGWTVLVCNRIADATLPVDFDYYVDQVERLCNILG